jgi:acyl dehydratase
MASRFAPVRVDWSPDDVIRYHLAIGAGAPRCEGPELRYVFEDALQVLPTFATVAASAAASIASAGPGLDSDPDVVVQGGHEMEVLAPVPAEASSRNTARVEAVYDKQRFAVVVVRVETALDNGELLTVNRFTLLLPGAGGFGGDPGPPGVDAGVRGASPDAVYSVATLPQQAALYRMSGDRHHLHIDPVAARAAGFPAPPLPGLCTWAMAGKALVDRELGGNLERVAGLVARFGRPVYPGETVDLCVYRRPEGLRFEGFVAGRSGAVLGAGLMRIRDPGDPT